MSKAVSQSIGLLNKRSCQSVRNVRAYLGNAYVLLCRGFEEGHLVPPGQCFTLSLRHHLQPLTHQQSVISNQQSASNDQRSADNRAPRTREDSMSHLLPIRILLTCLSAFCNNTKMRTQDNRFMRNRSNQTPQQANTKETVQPHKFQLRTPHSKAKH